MKEEAKEDSAARFVSVETLATMTDLSRSFWQKKLLRRELPSVKVGRCVRIRLANALAYLDERERPAVRR